MAKITFDGVDDLIQGINDLHDRSAEIVDAMLHAGGDTLKKGLRDTVVAYNHVRTGSMRDKIGYSAPRGDANGKYVSVYPRGTDKRGTSNALKAFVINYSRPGDRWFDVGAASNEQQVISAMSRAFEKKVDEITE